VIREHRLTKLRSTRQQSDCCGALLLQLFYTVRSERMLMEQLEYNLLFRSFVALSERCGGLPKGLSTSVGPVRSGSCRKARCLTRSAERKYPHFYAVPTC
jgi:hypothetical protein